MQLDTERLKATIQLELDQTIQKMTDLEKELSRLEKEQDRLISNFHAVEAIERISSELEEEARAGSAQEPSETTRAAGAGHDQTG